MQELITIDLNFGFYANFDLCIQFLRYVGLHLGLGQNSKKLILSVYSIRAWDDRAIQGPVRAS